MSELVVVTGGTGYIAGWCIAELLRRGYHVRATVRSAARGDRVRSAVARFPGADDRLSFGEADLTQDAGWDSVMDGADYVLHVASPLGEGTANADRDALVGPARDGTLRVLGAAVRAGVRRVVMTSAANAASPSSYASEGVTDETLWTDPDDPTIIPYRRSKTLAERAAWDFMTAYGAEHGAAQGAEQGAEQGAAPGTGHGGATSLATILPGAVFGPILTTDTIGSVGIISRMVAGSMPGVPRIGLEIVDVRDLADIHLRAMTSDAAAGERFLATGEFMWMRDMAGTLRAELGPDGARIATRQLPDFAVRLAARFTDPSLRGITPSLGRRNRHSTEKARRVLGWQPRPAAETVVDCARSLLEHGVVQRRLTSR
jgi:dihydroflavonol-4-reductase